jgi:hypothetical protein
LHSTAGKKEAGATAAVGGTGGLHGGGVTGDRPELGSGGQGITAGWPEVRGRIGELVPSLTGGWAAARRPGDETVAGVVWGGRARRGESSPVVDLAWDAPERRAWWS